MNKEQIYQEMPKVFDETSFILGLIVGAIAALISGYIVLNWLANKKYYDKEYWWNEGKRPEED
jgi:H+/gluconate symporter-like permease